MEASPQGADVALFEDLDRFDKPGGDARVYFGHDKLMDLVGALALVFGVLHRLLAAARLHVAARAFSAFATGSKRAMNAEITIEMQF